MVLSYGKDGGSRRLGVIEKHRLPSEHSSHEDRRRLWGWFSKFIRWLFGIKSTKAQVQQESEPEPNNKVNCKVSSWGPFSACRFTESEGWTKTKICNRVRTRTIVTHPEHGGSSCPALEADEYCDSCTAVCGDGKQVAGEQCDDGNGELPR